MAEKDYVRVVSIAMAVVLLGLPVCALAQRGGRGTAPRTPKEAAPIDITGYWVSVVTEDWRFRMLTPPKGDYESVPLNAEGKRVADAWDPARDEAAGEQCKAYGAPAVFRMPGRLHIYWENDTTLRIDTDAGTQTRLLHYGQPERPAGAPTWQGYSVAAWEYAGVGPASGRGAGGAGDAAKQNPGGSLRVLTTHLRPGYLRKNGVPYSGNAVLTEYFDRTVEDNGDVWLFVTASLNDPRYLTEPFIVSTNFKKLPNASGWNPTPCSVK